MSLKSKDKGNAYIYDRLKPFIMRNGYIPKFFVPYNAIELIDYACTLSTECGTPGHISNILIFELEKEKNE